MRCTKGHTKTGGEAGVSREHPTFLVSSEELVKQRIYAILFEKYVTFSFLTKAECDTQTAYNFVENYKRKYCLQTCSFLFTSL
jgi:hypothetical protein